MKRVAPSELIHNKMQDLFKYYIIVGGMPEVVSTFIETHDIGKVIEKQKDILALYRQDISKYSKKTKPKLQMSLTGSRQNLKQKPDDLIWQA